MILQQQGCKKITEFGRINFDLENQPLSRHMGMAMKWIFMYIMVYKVCRIIGYFDNGILLMIKNDYL